MNRHWLAIGAAVLSLILLPGWYYLKQKRNNDKFWENISEQWPGRLAQFFYFVGIPYFVIIFGGLSPKLLGLKGLDHFNLINWNSDFLAVQVQQAITLMLLEWLLDSSLTILVGSVTLLGLVSIWLGLKRHGVEFTPAPEPMLRTVYYALHWAFYRAVFWLITGELYLGVVLGSGLVILEWLLIQTFQNQSPTQRQQFLTSAIILILTATIFFYSPNLWLLLPIQLTMVSIINKGQGAIILHNNGGQQWKTP